MSGFLERENQLFDILRKFNDSELEFIVIGGFAVSAFQSRSSVDVDLVITTEMIDQFTDILTEEEYEKITEKELEQGRFVEYQKDEELPISVDLMVSSVQSRHTGASWSYKELLQEARMEEIEGADASVTVMVPRKELLIAMKLHSGRPTDARDVVALAEDIDFDKVAEYVQRGKKEQLQQLLEQMHRRITGETFADSFKGVFSEGELPRNQIRRVADFLKSQIDQLESE